MERVARIVKDEEYRYANTFLVAEKVFQNEVKSMADGQLPGAMAFKLYDTYGLAIDEQEEMAREAGISIDLAGFQTAMQGQKERARASWKGAEKGQIVPAYQTLLLENDKTKFLGYEHLRGTSRVIGLLIDKESVTGVPAGLAAEIVLDQTPFYAETGGQVGDRGTLISLLSGDIVAQVETVFPGVPGLSVHRINTLGAIQAGRRIARGGGC